MELLSRKTEFCCCGFTLEEDWTSKLQLFPCCLSIKRTWNIWTQFHWFPQRAWTLLQDPMLLQNPKKNQITCGMGRKRDPTNQPKTSKVHHPCSCISALSCSSCPLPKEPPGPRGSPGTTHQGLAKRTNHTHSQATEVLCLRTPTRTH